MATHSSIPAWRIPWTEKPGGLQRGRKESDTTERLNNSPRVFSVQRRKPAGLLCLRFGDYEQRGV